ncbi:MAG: ATP-dependent helicase [Chitinophagales bacterium]|jgi:DNA helicase-2/ATP-dependent DNA helicase PcrA|nr:ATP-dependent helicase [Sphingobacteriales bacterium]
MNQEKYTQAYQGLNEKQKQAVDTIYGPLMVIAGPGTGKTQLLSTRIGHILRETDFRPFNILCLTYTTSGVAAMKQRLVELIGPEGNDVEVYTFHSFAEKVIQRYSRYNDLETFQFIDDIDKKILVRELLEEVEFNTPLKKGVSSVDSSISFILSIISQIKKEKYDADSLIHGIKVELISKKDSEEFVYKQKYKEFKAGDLKKAKWDAFENKLNKNIQALQIYKKYNEIVTSRKLMDFDDMLLKALELLDNSEDLRLDIQEQYQVILVDEFQDTSGAQLDLIHQLCRDIEDPNVMVVGDEDQSIYRFQGANLFNIHDFHKRYLAHLPAEEQYDRMVVLDKNYRSTPVILDVSRVLIEKNTERITNIIEGKTIIKKLEAAHPSLKASSEPIELIEVENKEDEMLPIVLKIEDLVKKGVNFKDIAVLFPNNNQMIDFAQYLAVLDYPYELSKDENILEDKLILSYIQIFYFIQDFANRKVLSPEQFGELLMHPWMGISLYDISRFWVEVKELEIRNPLDFLQFLEKYQGIEKIEHTLAIYKTCVQKLPLMPPQRFFHFVLDSFQIKEWALKQPQRMDILQKIEVLDNFLKDYLNKLENGKMNDFINRLEAYLREDVAIPYSKRFQSENSINLMTYHKSKGLEYDYVFVYNAGRYTNRSKESLYVPEELIDLNLSEDNEKSRNEEEKRRLLYVAMTRAKKKLYLTDIVTDGKGDSKNKFKVEINPISEEEMKKTPDIAAPVISSIYKLTENDYTRFEALNISALAIKEEELFENNFIHQRLENYKMSHSTMNTYLECPQKFYMDKMISIPSETSFQMSMGNFYHSLLENFDKMVNDQPEKDSLEELLQMARQLIYNYRGLMTEIEFRDVQQALETNLPLLYHQYLQSNKATNFELEASLEMKIGPCLFTGKLDKIIFDDNAITIVDYKTGKLSNSKKKHKLDSYNPEKELKEEATIDEIYGGNYWRQAVIYSMLVKENYPDKKLQEVRYVYILPEDKEIKVFTFQPTMEDEKYMKNLILTTFEKIQNKEFGCCQKIECPWCEQLAHRQSLN